MSRKRDHERALFAAFLEVAPEFAGEHLADWNQPQDERDFPDIIGTTVAGRKIGVEIGEWLNEDETQAAKQKERLEQAFLNAIGDQGQNPTRHIRFIWLRPKQKIASADVAGFKDQLFACILEYDQRWPNERFWKVGHQLVGDEFAAHPLLGKYLNAIKLWPVDGDQWKESWITFPMRVNVFDRETMLGPLRKLVAEKIGHYSATRTGFDDLSLLVIYNLAAIYNSPVDTPFHTFDDAVAVLKQVIAENQGPFDRVFIYIAVEPGARVLQACDANLIFRQLCASVPLMFGERLIAVANRLAARWINDGLRIPIVFAINDSTSAHPSAESRRETVTVLLLTQRLLYAKSLVLETEISMNRDGLADRDLNKTRE